MVSQEEELYSGCEEATRRSTYVVSAQGIAVSCLYGRDFEVGSGTVRSCSKNVRDEH